MRAGEMRSGWDARVGEWKVGSRWVAQGGGVLGR